jgi:hypothetical protein
MNNRLGDIPAWAMEDSDEEDDMNGKDNGFGGGDIELAEAKPQYMEDFFREVDTIKADIDAVSQASKDIAKINEQSMQATTTSEEQKLSKMLKPLIDSTNKRAKRTKNLLGLLKQETDQLKEQGKLNASDIRYVIIDSSFMHSLPYHNVHTFTNLDYYLGDSQMQYHNLTYRKIHLRLFCVFSFQYYSRGLTPLFILQYVNIYDKTESVRT